MSFTLPLTEALGFSLTMTRCLAFFLVAPLFGHQVVPVRVKVSLAFLLAVLLAEPAPLGAIQSLPLTVVREVLIGATLGLVATLIFAGFAMMAEFASIQGGLGAASVLDPSSGASSVVLTQMIQAFALLAFLASDGHHLLLRAIDLSFAALPVAGGPPPADAFLALARIGGQVFEVGLRIAAPFTAIMLLSNLAVGMLGRAIPQLNLMALQLPAQIAVTLAVLAIAAGPLTETLARTTHQVIEQSLPILWEGQ